MDPVESKNTCESILAMYKYDPEEAHIWEDKFLKRTLKTLVKEIQSLSPDTDEIKSFQKTTEEYMQHITAMLATKRTKWYS